MGRMGGMGRWNGGAGEAWGGGVGARKVKGAGFGRVISEHGFPHLMMLNILQTRFREIKQNRAGIGGGRAIANSKMAPRFRFLAETIGARARPADMLLTRVLQAQRHSRTKRREGVNGPAPRQKHGTHGVGDGPGWHGLWDGMTAPPP
jgi:hypothetical protein